MVDRNILKTADHDWYRQRLNGAMAIVLAAFVLLLVRLFYLQVIEGEEYRRLSENNCIRLQSIDPPRGQILDRHGRLLVDNLSGAPPGYYLTAYLWIYLLLRWLLRFLRVAGTFLLPLAIAGAVGLEHLILVGFPLLLGRTPGPPPGRSPGSSSGPC